MPDDPELQAPPVGEGPGQDPAAAPEAPATPADVEPVAATAVVEPERFKAAASYDLAEAVRGEFHTAGSAITFDIPAGRFTPETADQERMLVEVLVPANLATVAKEA